MNSQIGYLVGLSVEYIQKGSLDDAERLLKKALKMAPKNSEVLRLMGVIFAFKKDFYTALKMFDASIKYGPKNWLSHSNRGNILKDLNRFEEALKSYDFSIALHSNYAEVYNNKGNALIELNQYEASIVCYEKAISLQPNYADAYHGMGNAFKKIHNLPKALASYEMARKFDPSTSYILSSVIDTKMLMCDWSGVESQIEDLYSLGLRSHKKIHPFHLLSIFDDPHLLRDLTEQYMLEKYPIRNDLHLNGVNADEGKIRIGYFSADFYNHPVSFLVAGMLEAHDHQKFETIAFSVGRPKADEMRTRLESAFDLFIDVSYKEDRQIAELARELKVDIAIDLGGLTENNRPGIFSYRAAPIQIGYIGYLGTMGAPYMDYIIADEIIIPPEFRDAYSEKIIYLPSYQANDPKRQISDRVFTREELGLPSKGFVYCCFNNNYKITPSIFDSWSKILKNVDGSVFFIYADNESVKKNLSSAIEARGINSGRLIFGKRLPREEYLARYRVADLFLDTSPYNAGTTASDALWTGLPVITFLGKTFSARMGGSILKAIGLPELVVSSQDEYEALAIELGRHPDKILEIKKKLEQNRLTMPLFDAKLFTQNLELALTKAYKRFQNGLPPEHIY